VTTFLIVLAALALYALGGWAVIWGCDR